MGVGGVGEGGEREGGRIHYDMFRIHQSYSDLESGATTGCRLRSSVFTTAFPLPGDCGSSHRKVLVTALLRIHPAFAATIPSILHHLGALLFR